MLLLDLIGAPDPTFRNVIDPSTGLGGEKMNKTKSSMIQAVFDLPGECDTLFSVLAAIEDALTSLCPSCMPGPRLTKQCLPF